MVLHVLGVLMLTRMKTKRMNACTSAAFVKEEPPGVVVVVMLLQAKTSAIARAE
jgi:hypothetical protein